MRRTQEATISHTLRIELDNADAVYRPGDAVRGQVVLASEGELHPRGVSLHAIGTEFTNWGTQPAYIARTHSLDQHVELWTPAREGEPLAAGTYTFPFAIDLPPDAPPSFDGLLTEIGYGLRAKVDLPRHIDLHAETGFIVLAAAPVGEDKAIQVEAHDESGRRIQLSLPRSVVRLGDTLEGVLRITRPGEGRSQRVIVELLSRERGSAQGVWTEYVDREADLRIELEHVQADSSYPFAFKVPDSAAPTFSGAHSELSWHVGARLVVAHAPDVVIGATLTVVEP